MNRYYKLGGSSKLGKETMGRKWCQDGKTYVFDGEKWIDVLGTEYFEHGKMVNLKELDI